MVQGVEILDCLQAADKKGHASGLNVRNDINISTRAHNWWPSTSVLQTHTIPVPTIINGNKPFSIRQVLMFRIRRIFFYVGVCKLFHLILLCSKYTLFGTVNAYGGGV